MTSTTTEIRRSVWRQVFHWFHLFAFNCVFYHIFLKHQEKCELGKDLCTCCSVFSLLPEGYNCDSLWQETQISAYGTIFRMGIYCSLLVQQLKKIVFIYKEGNVTFVLKNILVIFIIASICLNLLYYYLLFYHDYNKSGKPHSGSFEINWSRTEWNKMLDVLYPHLELGLVIRIPMMVMSL